MTDPMPLVFSTLGCPNWSLDRIIEAALADDYAGIEIRILDGEVIPADLAAESRREIRSKIERNNLVIAGLGASTRFTTADGEERQENIDSLRRYLQLAHDLEAPMVRTFGGRSEDERPNDEVLDRVADSLSQVAEEADRLGVTVVLETHDAFCLGEDVAAVLDRVDHPRMRAVWDIHHPYRKGESVEDTRRFLGDRLAHVHLKDARKREDGSWQLVLLDEGEVPARQIVDLLLDEGYDGYLAVEWEKAWHPEIEEPDVALPQHAALIRQWFDQHQKG